MTSYPFAVGRVKAAEVHLLDKAKWNRLWEADEQEAIRLLEESGYGAGSDTKAASLEALIDQEMDNARGFIRAITPNPALTELFLLPTDAHNLKVLLKAQMLHMDVSDLLLDGGTLPIDLLPKWIEADDYSQLPCAFQEAITAWKEKTPDDPQRLCAAVDQAVFVQIAAVLKKQKCALLTRYFTAQIDFLNVLSLLRARILGWNGKKLQPLLLTGGSIPHKDLLDAVEVPLEQLSRTAAQGTHRDFLRGLLEEAAQNNNAVTAAEQKCAHALTAILKEEKDDSFGIGPIACFYHQRETEAKALRTLFASKRAGILISLAELDVQ